MSLLAPVIWPKDRANGVALERTLDLIPLQRDSHPAHGVTERLEGDRQLRVPMGVSDRGPGNEDTPRDYFLVEQGMESRPGAAVSASAEDLGVAVEADDTYVVRDPCGGS